VLGDRGGRHVRVQGLVEGGAAKVLGLVDRVGLADRHVEHLAGAGDLVDRQLQRAKRGYIAVFQGGNSYESYDRYRNGADDQQQSNKCVVRDEPMAGPGTEGRRYARNLERKNK